MQSRKIHQGCAGNKVRYWKFRMTTRALFILKVSKSRVLGLGDRREVRMTCPGPIFSTAWSLEHHQVQFWRSDL